MSPKSSKDDAAEIAAKVRTYFAAVPPDIRRELQRIRDAIQAAAPTAEESFGYGIPSFKLDGKPLMFYAAWKNHVSVYPVTPAIRQAHGEELERYEVAKGTIRFPADKPAPVTFIKRLAKTRIAEVRAKAKA